MTNSDMQELFLPVHKYVELLPQEVAIINFPEFQRLWRCRQLGFAHFLFPGATHTRFEHSLGTLHVAQCMIDAVNTNYQRQYTESKDSHEETCKILSIDNLARTYIRLAALLHDIVHIPFGHTFEDELKHLDKHDGAERVETIAERVAPRYTVNPALGLEINKPLSGWTLRQLIDAAYAHIPGQPIGLADLTPKPTPFEILKLIICKTPRDEKAEIAWQTRSREIS